MPQCVPCPKAVIPLSSESVLALTHPDGCHTWTWGLKLSWDSPGKTGQDVPSSEPAAWVPTCLHPCAPPGIQSGLVLSGLKAPAMGLAGARAGCYLGSPFCHCLSVPLCGCADDLLLHNTTLRKWSLMEDSLIPVKVSSDACSRPLSKLKRVVLQSNRTQRLCSGSCM